MLIGNRRITILAGHYGSGKTNIAVNLAMLQKRAQPQQRVVVADLDIVNPYFRTKDAANELAAAGVEMVVSDFASSNVDFPAMPKEAYALFARESVDKVIADVGGDDRGALALGRYVPEIVAGGDYEFLAVINASRPLTMTVADTVEVLREIEEAAGLKFTGIINNTNLGRETTAATLLCSLDYANEVSKAMALPLVANCCERHLASELAKRVDALLPIELTSLYYNLNG